MNKLKLNNVLNFESSLSIKLSIAVLDLTQSLQIKVKEPGSTNLIYIPQEDELVTR